MHAAAYECEDEPVGTVLDADVAICVLRIALSPAEALLISDHADAVHDQRQAFEHALAPSMSAAVERATGRTVTGFHTATHLTPSVTLLTFEFAPRQRPELDSNQRPTP
ncbi:MAG: Na-translocating system protein MpsC family protein [Solirubrobacteraceae bacterium]